MTAMNEQKRLGLLIVVMTAVALIIGGSAIYVLYRGSIDRERARLHDIIRGQARLLEAMARFDQTYSIYPGGPEAASLWQFLDSRRTLAANAPERSEEITLARRVGDDIVFLATGHGAGLEHPVTIPVDSRLAAPMRAALEGRSGTMIGRDYRGVMVLAAYEPIAVLELGLVAKVDVDEIRNRFTRAAMPVSLIGLIAVVAGTALFSRITEPMLRRMRENEARFRGLFDHMKSGAAVFRAADGGDDFVFADLNRQGETIGQIVRREVVGRPVTEVFPGVRDFGLFETMRDVWTTGIARDVPAHFYRDGRLEGWRDSHVYKLPTGEIVSLFDDVTEQKQAEQALIESETRTRALLDASEDEILLVATDGRVLAINEAARRRLAGRTAGIDPAGTALTRLLPADLAQARLATVRDVAVSGKPVHLDVPIRNRWFEFWFYPVRHADRPITEVAVYAREITDRKHAEQELRRLYQAIQRSPVSVVITDRDGRIVYVNPAFCEVTGYGLDEAMGRNPRILKSGLTPAEDYEALWRTITAGDIWRGEFCNRKKNGELFWEVASIAPVNNDAGEIVNFVAVKEDVTERRAVEEQLRQSQKMEAIGQLTGGIAHDFNNLLTIIAGNLELIEQRHGGDERSRELVTDALWAARRGGELTHRLLAFARMQPLRPTIVSLNDVVRGMTSLLRRTLGSKIAVAEELDASVPSVLADAGELERALVNLAINARDAMPDGGTLTLQTRTAVLDEDYAERYRDVVPGDYVMLAVSDTGTGIDRTVLGRIFEPFFTTKEIGHGSGLGLSMVYGFLKQSGGHVSVYSEVGAGSTFKLFFPRAAVSGAPAVEAAEGGAFIAAGRVALLVEDEERLRKLAVRFLEDLGFTVLEAGDGGAARHHAEAAARIDLLFTDVELPGGMSGLAVADTVRARHPGVRVLYTTGYAAGLGSRNGRLPPDAPVLPKPYARTELTRRLHALFTEGERRC